MSAVESHILDQAQTLPLSALVESILYAAADPASISSLAAALDASIQDVEAALAELTGQYAGRGVKLQRHGNQVQLVTSPESAERVQKYLGLESLSRLSSAAIETLAIIAYKQPITKPQIEMIRGVNCDGVMKTLELHNLIQELGRVETVGRPMRYGVSFEFLQHFGLTGTHELPAVENLSVLPAPSDSSESDSLESIDVSDDALATPAAATPEANASAPATSTTDLDGAERYPAASAIDAPDALSPTVTEAGAA